MSSIDTPVGPSSSSESGAASEANPADPAVVASDAGDGLGPTTPTIAGFRMPRTGTVIVALIAIALAMRLWQLGDRPFHHDESLDAWWSWLFREGRFDRYDPVYHGPLRFYITAGFYELFGESTAVARLFSALTGTAVVGLPWFLRRELGRAGTIAAAVALTVSPTMLYYSRFGREDAQMVFLALLALVLGLSYLRRPRVATAAGLAFTLACSFAIKESTYLFGLLLAVYLAIVIAAQFEAQGRGTKEADGTIEFHRGFFVSALLFATLGLLAAVVVGSAADELFPMLALYMAALALFVLAAAMPRLRAAGIRWSSARAAGVLVSLIVLAQLVRAYRGEPGQWSASILALALGVVLILLATALFSILEADAIPERGRWATALAVGGAGAIGLQWISWRAAQTAAAREFNDSVAVHLVFGALGIVIALIGAAEWTSRRNDPALADSPRTLAAGLTALGGLAFALNEVTNSEANRLIAVLAIVIALAAITLLVRSLPSAKAGFVWPPLLRAFGAIGWIGWLITLFVFAASWWLFFTVWGNVREDWASGFTRAIDYWDSQQEVNRGGQPWYYYLYALPAYEWFFVGLASVGTWRALRRPTLASGLFVWFSIGSLILYSYAGERMPWLIAHPLLPMLILAGYGVQQLWEHRGNRAMPTIAMMCLVGLLATTGIAWRASFPNGADSREILSQAGQATPHLTAALERLDNIDRISRQATGEGATLAIGTANAWPYNWYLRDRPDVLWFTNCKPDDEPGTCGPAPDQLDRIDVIIGDFSAIDVANYPDFQPTLFAMRSWWVPTYTDAGPVGWFNYVRGVELWEQEPNSSYAGLQPIAEDTGPGGLGETLDKLQDGLDARSQSFVNFSGADGDVVSPAFPSTEFDDGRDGCGSVDQWFMVRNQWAGTERQVYPGPIDDMGPLECVSDQLAGS